MTDPIADGARAAAERLTLTLGYGPGLAADVETALRTRESKYKPERYFDPVWWVR